MQLMQFAKESGFKVLALLKLSPCEYGVILYLLNCAASDLDQIVTNETELSSLIGYEESTLRSALALLSERRMIKIHYGVTTTDLTSFRLGLQFDISEWSTTKDTHESIDDAIVYPFRLTGDPNLKILTSKPQHHGLVTKNEDIRQTINRILDGFLVGRSFDEKEFSQHEQAAAMLLEAHPPDHILLMVRYFGKRIPSLSLLASSWQHFQEIFQEETQKIDMLGARQKHAQSEAMIRRRARDYLERRNELNLSDAEASVLEILIKHQHPRRQLFWAHQAKGRYPNLHTFFDANEDLMIGVTTKGLILGKKSSLTLSSIDTEDA